MIQNNSFYFDGDKSLTHRAFILSSIALGESIIKNYASGKDCISTLNCLSKCGLKFSNDKGEIRINGSKLKDPSQPLDCGNSGTTARLLIGFLAGQGINATFTGDSSLQNRPMNRVLKPLSKMGLKFECNNGKLPIKIYKSKLKSIKYESPIASAQVKSAVLLAGIGASGTTFYKEPIISRDHTEKMLQYMGLNIKIGEFIEIEGKQAQPQPINFQIPGDISSSSFIASVAALFPGKKANLKSVLLNTTRTYYLHILQKMGAIVQFENQRNTCNEKIGDVKISHKQLRGITIDPEKVPFLIDELPILSILATQAIGITKVTGAEELRVKESDRINAICKNLKKMGVKVEELKDGFIIEGPNELVGTEVETFNDHRIAMAFSIASLLTSGQVEIDNSKCVSISYPNFFDHIKRLTQ